MRAARRLRSFWGWALAAVLLLGLTLAYAQHQVSAAAAGRLYSRADDVGAEDVALVLGTAPQVGAQPNLFYVERLRAVTRLWRLGKVRAVLISGDNSRADYNEPDRMKADLVEAGLPPEFITCDYAGRRTMDSVVRAQRVFGLQRVIIVSQREHLERALYLARHAGLQAQGLAAADAPRWWQVRQHLREALARVQAVLDVALQRQPHFLGPTLPVRLAPVLV